MHKHPVKENETLGSRWKELILCRERVPVTRAWAQTLGFQDLEGLTEACDRMSTGLFGPKLPLWADFAFLISRKELQSATTELDSEKILLVSVKVVSPQFWGRKWVRQFYGRLEKCVLSAEKTHVHKIPRFGGGGILGLAGGGECPFYFYGRADFFLNYLTFYFRDQSQ